jgi:amino acid adenylation domain-containing protein
MSSAFSSEPAKDNPSEEVFIFPVSFAQERLWLLDQLEPDRAVYNVPSAVTLPGNVNADVLRRALNEIVKRHEVLRTKFMSVDGKPSQVILPSLNIELPVHDLRNMSAGERQAEVARLTEAEARRPFDLSQGPLLRAQLLRVTNEQNLLLLTMHHIISDGWSVGIFFRELSLLYEAAYRGQRSSLPELPIQYADYAQWQRERLSGTTLAELLGYWRNQLAGAPVVLELPLDKVRPPVQSFRGEVRTFQLGVELTRRLRELSQRSGVTLFMTLLAAFKVLLYRYTGEEDLVVGTPIAGRNRAEIEGLIGFFTNSLVLRARLSGNPSFAEFLQRVREVTLGAYEHQDLPFEKLVEELQPERSLSHNPLFQVFFSLQNNPTLATVGSDTEAAEKALREMPEVNTGSAKFDLALMMSEMGEQLIGGFEYNTDLFEPATIARMEGHYRRLLDAILADPQRTITQLPLLSDNEELQLRQWNETKVEYREAGACLHELFAAQAQRTPERVAVIAGEQQWTYAELDERANQIAWRLQQLGCGIEERVGICVQRSLEMTAGMLGVLKAGATYVPLDPAYPQERLKLMVRDAGVRLVLTQSWLAEQLPEGVAQVIYLDEGWETKAQHQYKSPKVSPDSLVYVIYTSGSTGIPKGVALSHRAVVNLILWQIEDSRLAEGAKTAQFHSFSFDVSCQEMFSTWASGGSLVLITEEDRKDVNQLLVTLSEKGVERLFLPPVALQQLAEAPIDRTLPKTLKHVIAAGEQLQITQPLLNFFGRLKNCALHNQYGPSESHIVTEFALPLSPDDWPTFPPIGRPIANTQMHLLDERLQQVPVSVPGQLYIGGVCLARGYLNRPDMTAERFIPDHLSNQPGARLYRTGDLARYLADGNIEFLGRIDNQVKVRGFRIEPGEIEATLRRHPSVQEAVVVVRGQEDKRLIAYLISDHDPPPSTTELIRFLGETLPAYMIPSIFVFLDALPLTPSGKVDRRSLPAPDQQRPTLEHVFVAPRTPVEQILAEIWTSVLGLQQVGINDNFFELGGHSLLGTQIVSRVRSLFEVELPLRCIFESPTIALLALEITSLKLKDIDNRELDLLLREVEQLSDEQARVFLSAGT